MGSMARKSTRSAKESKGVAASKSKKRRSNSNANSVAASISTTTIGSSCESSSSASRSTFLEVMRRQRNSFQTFFVIYSTSDEPVPDHVMEHFSQETIFHFNDANDIQENSKFVMCSSSLELVEALRNRPRPGLDLTTSSISCTPSVPSFTGMSVKVWKRVSSARPERTWLLSRRTTKRSVSTLSRASKTRLRMSSKQLAFGF